MKRQALLLICAFFFSWTNYFPGLNLLTGQSMSPGDFDQYAAQPEAMWDLEWDWDLLPLLGTGSVRGGTWLNQTFWITDSQTDSLYLLDNNGIFLQTVFIPSAGPNSGFTSLTHNGSFLFGVNLGDFISRIDPNTFSLVDSIALPPGTNALFLEYDPNLDSGNGGFHVGGINGGSIFQYDLNGALLGEIMAAVHGLNNIVGLAHDDFSPGGPYLWAFSQEGIPSNAVISQLQLPLGSFTGTQQDASADLTGSNHLAGDLFVVPLYPPLNHALLTGIIQNPGDRLFAYELNFQPLTVDVALDLCRPMPAYTQIPVSQLVPMDFHAELLNSGTDSVSQGQLKMSIADVNQTVVYADTQNWVSLAPAQTQVHQLGPWTPTAKGQYRGWMALSTGPQVDMNADNDSCLLSLFVNDSVFARDDGLIQEALGIGPDSNDQAILGQNFALEKTDFCTSVTMVLVHPPAGEMVSASIYEVDASGKPLNLLGKTVDYLISQTDALDTLWLTLPFPNAPLGLPPGSFYVGVNEAGKKIQLAASARYWVPGTTWLNWNNNPQGDWANMEDFSLKVSFLLRPNFGPCSPSYLNAQLQILDDDSGQEDAALQVLVSGGAPPYTYQWNDPLSQNTAQIIGQAGGRTYSCIITDQNACQTSLTSDTVNQWTTSLETVELLGFVLFPNPTQDEIQLEIQLREASVLQIRIWDLRGSLLSEETFPSWSFHAHTLSMETYDQGIYLLEVQTNRGNYYRRISRF